MGGPQGPDARLEHPEDGGPRRGPPDRLLRLRRHHPRAPVRRRRRDRLGLGHLGRGGAHARRAQGDRGRRAQVHPQGREAARQVHDRADRRPPRRRHGPAVRGRLRAVAAHPQAWARVDRGLGRRGVPDQRQDRPHERRGQGQQGRDLDQPGARRRGRDRPVASARGADAQPHRTDARHAHHQGLRRPRLAVRDQVGRVPGAGRGPRRRRAAVHAEPPRRGNVFRAAALAAQLDRRP